MENSFEYTSGWQRVTREDEPGLTRAIEHSHTPVRQAACGLSCAPAARSPAASPIPGESASLRLLTEMNSKLGALSRGLAEQNKSLQLLLARLEEQNKEK